MARFSSLKEWLKWQEKLHPRSIDLGLERVAGVYKALNPKGDKAPTIIVAGTNGKGSCVAFLEAIYSAQGYRVGTYTSPHILKYNERIKIEGKPVRDALICDAFERIDIVRNDVSLSYFEFGTLAAIDLFWRSKVDVQILEVGLGGRLDAVNILDADTTLITNISIDHIDWLGETREAIGYEKAGVFRTGVAAIIGDLAPPDSLINYAIEKRTPVFRINHEFDFKKRDNDWDWQCTKVEQKKYKVLPPPSLKGEHQYRNASTVLMAVTEMESLLPISEKAIHQGLKNTQLNGRFQLIKGDVPILLDVAHNPQSVKELFNYLTECFSGYKIYTVFSMMKDKDIKGVIDIISPVIQHWFVSPLTNPRTASQAHMKKQFKACAIENVNFGYKDFSETYSAARDSVGKGDLILIFGSFFLVSEYLANKEDD